MYGRCLEGVWMVSGWCWEGVWRVLGGVWKNYFKHNFSGGETKLGQNYFFYQNTVSKIHFSLHFVRVTFLGIKAFIWTPDNLGPKNISEQIFFLNQKLIH